MTNGQNEATGVVLEDGTEVKAKVILSNATAQITYINLLDKVSYILIYISSALVPQGHQPLNWFCVFCLQNGLPT